MLLKQDKIDALACIHAFKVTVPMLLVMKEHVTRSVALFVFVIVFEQ